MHKISKSNSFGTNLDIWGAWKKQLTILGIQMKHGKTSKISNSKVFGPNLNFFGGPAGPETSEERPRVTWAIYPIWQWARIYGDSK